MRVKFCYNGLKVDGALYRCRYYDGQYTDASGIPAGTITIYRRDYGRTPDIDGLTIHNETDTMTDYFETDRIMVFPDSPFYDEVKEACRAAKIHNGKLLVKHYEKAAREMRGTSREQYYRDEYERAVKRLEALGA